MKEMPTEGRRVEAVKTTEGWCSLNIFYHMDWPAWRQVDQALQTEYINQLIAVLNQWTEVEAAEKGSHAFYSVLGQKADLHFWILRPTMAEIHDAQHQLEKLPIADFFIPAYSFVSILEASNYLPVEFTDDHPMVRAKLYPTSPKLMYSCFYPMNKKRDLDDNWYMLSLEQRRPLMASHGETGRKYKDTLKQYTAGSIGLDDWEWGITLIGDDPVEFKKIVTEMRFDEVSARYGEFGPFYISKLLPMDHIQNHFKL